jgi:hypothetical protein
MLFNYFVRVSALLIAITGFFMLGYYYYAVFPEVNPQIVVCIAIPDMLFFYLAYKTYPQQVRKQVQ